MEFLVGGLDILILEVPIDTLDLPRHHWWLLGKLGIFAGQRVLEVLGVEFPGLPGVLGISEWRDPSTQEHSLSTSAHQMCPENQAIDLAASYLYSDHEKMCSLGKKVSQRQPTSHWNSPKTSMSHAVKSLFAFFFLRNCPLGPESQSKVF